MRGRQTGRRLLEIDRKEKEGKKGEGSIEIERNGGGEDKQRKRVGG